MHRNAIKAVAKFIYPATRREEGREASRTWVELEEEEEAAPLTPGAVAAKGPMERSNFSSVGISGAIAALHLRLRSPSPPPSPPPLPGAIAEVGGWTAVPGAPRCTSLADSSESSPAATAAPFSTINLATRRSAAVAVGGPRALFPTTIRDNPRAYSKMILQCLGVLQISRPIN
uniref:Uncharacterized protein n=2 Tax=Oryza TaxID=4527 RepID=A0A679B9R2_9ORYZ|nr:hypothetical protein [Oryza barthii]BBF89217.1 hypothetical protein [Oryza barthii]BBF89222.1 hypothetical protein [Oryza barthii]BBF89452.1 hypothetical protein [Oryza glaberrima]